MALDADEILLLASDYQIINNWNKIIKWLVLTPNKDNQMSNITNNRLNDESCECITIIIV